jgi:FlaA1/EpsC-like NDP-sugar epimerase
MDGSQLMEEQILELTRQVTILNERLPNHITWTERNVKDHEIRLRNLEERTPANLREQLQMLNQFKWIMVGIAGASGSVGAIITKIIGG